MSDKVTAAEFVKQAESGGYIGIPYSRLDCQAFVEKVLSGAGVKNPATGKAYNWRGSNHMWRNAVTDRRPIDSAIPAGAWVFTIKADGGEIARGYHDGMKNAAHIGIYLGGGRVMHSTTGGVQMDSLNSRRWTHYAKALCIDYDNPARDVNCLCADCANYKICGGVNRDS